MKELKIINKNIEDIKARGSKTKTIYRTGCYLRGDNNC